ncbi:hypothetical protein BDP27DRAFT_1423883 [Rhodocollybia butyracea]|uniref:Uncharacterized protein n=1 Tax=Rhodocollybia butyracea TaxID=206335 RepID=A0A9P5PQY2_9AGAR|nr:hypothetical protein BDP27DRAFT_1423883 [Rhodocollybia butyracea]
MTERTEPSLRRDFREQQSNPQDGADTLGSHTRRVKNSARQKCNPILDISAELSHI